MNPLRLLLRSALPLFATLLLPACSVDPGSRNYDVTRYDLDAQYDWQKNRLVANVRIQLAPTEDGIEDLELDSNVDVKAVRIEGIGEVDFEVQPEKRLKVSLDGLTAKKDEPITVVIDYEAAPSDNLRPIGKRNGDPIDIRAVFTDSEPEGARSWMPSHDEPWDRAIFAVGLRMDPQETAIANGRLMADNPAGSSRYMRYETRYPLPTYLMAFAISDFETISIKRGDLPIEIWHRQGLPGDHQTMLTELSRMMGEMEKHFGPYPFERYALVLLPGHMAGGMENAGISFQRETSSTAPGLSGDLRLAAHELAHQWFGDLVTVKSWDDVWIKEGLATLLTEELVRPYVDKSSAGTLNGDSFSVVDGEAIRDPSKPPSLKYDSGPYDRSAWFFTQIRKVMGDEAFFGKLKGLLEKHRMGAIGVDEIVAAFAPAFGPGGEAKLRQALAAKALPRLSVDESGEQLTLQDHHGALLAPMEIEWGSTMGQQNRRETLSLDAPTFLVPNSPDELLVMDPDDVHPSWEQFFDSGGLPSAITGYVVPAEPNQFEWFLQLPGVHQQKALEYADGAGLPLDLTNLPTFLGSMHSDAAHVLALERACEAARAAGTMDTPDPQWTDAMKTAFATPPPAFGLSVLSGFVACTEVIDPDTLWADEWHKVAEGLPNGDISAERLFFLSRFDTHQQLIWPSVLDNAGSLRARQLASQRIRPVFNQGFLVDRARTIDAAETLRSSLIARLGNATRQSKAAWLEFGDPAGKVAFEEGLEALGVILRKDVTRPAHATAICTARNLLRDWQYDDEVPLLVLDVERWNRFVDDLKEAPLSERARAITKDETICD